MRSKPSARAGGKTKLVRRTLADGTVKEYRYPAASKAKAPAAPRILPGSVDAMLEAWQRSPEWADLAKSTRENYAIYLRVLYRLGRYPVAEIRRKHIIALRNAVAETRGRGAATGFIRASSAAWAWAMDNDLAEVSPVHRIKPLKRSTLPTWTEAVLERALAELPEAYRRVVLLAVHTGQRRADLCAMRWSAYDGAAIRVRQQKDRRPEAPTMVIPCHQALRAALDAWKAEDRPTLTILASPRGLPWTAQHLSRELTKEVAKLGLGRFTLHGLRKLAAVRLAEAGCTAHEIAAIGGWQTLSMVQHYTAAAEQETMARTAVGRLETARRENAENGS